MRILLGGILCYMGFLGAVTSALAYEALTGETTLVWIAVVIPFLAALFAMLTKVRE